MVPYSKIKDSPEPWNTDKDRAVSRQIALESVVLLKNDKNFLPLDKKSLKSIAVIGPLADSVHWDWYGGTPPYAVTPLAGHQRGAGLRVSPSTTRPTSWATPRLTRHASPMWPWSWWATIPTCGPDMRHDWYSTSEGGGVTLPCTVPERRPRRPRPRNHRSVSGTTDQAGLRRESQDGGHPGFQFPVCNQLDAGAIFPRSFT